MQKNEAAIIAFSDNGLRLAYKLAGTIPSNIYSKILNNFVRSDMDKIWNSYDAIVFIGAAGIAVRYIAQYVKSKDLDPAVLVIDDSGKFVISLLSGHIGGANELTKIISKAINGCAVITTASDNRNIESIDLFAIRHGYYIEDLQSVTPVMSLMVNNKRVGFYSEESSIINYPNIIKVKDLSNLTEEIDGLIVVSSSTETFKCNIPYTILRPKNINIGIGSKRGTDYLKLRDLLYETLENYKISIYSIKSIGTIDIKGDEESLLELANYLHLELRLFTAEELSQADHLYSGSEFVKSIVGVSNVSSSAAHLLGGRVFVEKVRGYGFTLSMSKEE